MKLHHDHILNWRDLSATRVVTSTLGILVGLAGIEHGFFEVLQGNVTPRRRNDRCHWSGTEILGIWN